MASLDWTDFEAAANSSLSDPDGRNLADRKSAAILVWSARHCNRVGRQKDTYVETFSPEDCASTFYLSALPLDPTQAVTVGTYNASTDAYDTYTGTARKNANGTFRNGSYLGYGPDSVRVGDTGGYDELPADLKQALTSILVQQVNDTINGGQVVTEVKALNHSEKYDLSGANIPGDALEVLDSYRLPVIA